jgi:hypothetical protein
MKTIYHYDDQQSFVEVMQNGSMWVSIHDEQEMNRMFIDVPSEECRKIYAALKTVFDPNDQADPRSPDL